MEKNICIYGKFFYAWLIPFDPSQVYEAKWWVGMYGAGTWKRHIAWSNSPTIQCLDLGTLCVKMKKKIARFGIKSTKQYKSRAGKKGFSGSKSLKSTGMLGVQI